MSSRFENLTAANDLNAQGMGPRSKVIITHSQRDMRFVFDVCDIVERLGFSPGLAGGSLRDLDVGSGMVTTIQSCAAQIVMCSHETNQSEGVRLAAQYGRAKGKRQIPIMLDRINDMDFFLRHFRTTPFVALWDMEKGPIAEAALRHELKRLLTTTGR